MSADSSQPSESNRTSPKNNGRYERAAQQALPAERASQREATRKQAEQDRAAHAAEREKLRGKAAEIDDISALLGAPESKKPDRSDRSVHSARDADDGAGRSGAEAPLRPDRPALELDDDEADDDQPKRRKKAKTLQAFVEEHELEPKAIYDLEISLEEGDEPVTIGKLKDHFKETRDLDQRRDEFEEWQTQSQNEVLTARMQIEQVLARVTDVVPPEVLARAFADMQADSTARLEKSRQQLAEWFPQWRDAQAKARDRERLEAALGSYGFSKFEVGAVQDARLVKFAMDAVNLMDRHKRLREDFQRDKKPSKEPASQRKERRISSTDRAKQIAASGDIVGGVAALIG
jgi:hypothetical protein